MVDLRVRTRTELPQALKAQREAAEHIPEIFDVIGQLLKSAIEDVFEAEGPGWQGLAPSTIARRRKGKNKSKSDKILQDTTIGIQSLGLEYGSNHIDAIFGAEYMGYHAPDAQGRNVEDLGPFEEPLLHDVAEVMGEERRPMSKGGGIRCIYTDAQFREHRGRIVGGLERTNKYGEHELIVRIGSRITLLDAPRSDAKNQPGTWRPVSEDDPWQEN